MVKNQGFTISCSLICRVFEFITLYRPLCAKHGSKFGDQTQQKKKCKEYSGTPRTVIICRVSILKRAKIWKPILKPPTGNWAGFGRVTGRTLSCHPPLDKSTTPDFPPLSFSQLEFWQLQSCDGSSNKCWKSSPILPTVDQSRGAFQ